MLTNYRELKQITPTEPAELLNLSNWQISQIQKSNYDLNNEIIVGTADSHCSLIVRKRCNGLTTGDEDLFSRTN